VLDAGPPGPARLVAVAAGEGLPAGGAVLAELALPDLTDPSSLAFHRGGAVAGFERDLLVATGDEGHLLRLRVHERHPPRVVLREALLQGVAGPIRVVAVGPDGAIYICTPRAILRMLKCGSANAEC